MTMMVWRKVISKPSILNNVNSLLLPLFRPFFLFAHFYDLSHSAWAAARRFGWSVGSSETAKCIYMQYFAQNIMLLTRVLLPASPTVARLLSSSQPRAVTPVDQRRRRQFVLPELR